MVSACNLTENPTAEITKVTLAMFTGLVDLGAELAYGEYWSRGDGARSYGDIDGIAPLFQHNNLELHNCGWYHHLFSALILWETDNGEDMDYGPLFCALLRKSEPTVHRLLRSSERSILERGHRRNSTSHCDHLASRY